MFTPPMVVLALFNNLLDASGGFLEIIPEAAMPPVMVMPVTMMMMPGLGAPFVEHKRPNQHRQRHQQDGAHHDNEINPSR